MVLADSFTDISLLNFTTIIVSGMCMDKVGPNNLWSKKIGWNFVLRKVEPIFVVSKSSGIKWIEVSNFLRSVTAWPQGKRLS